MKINKVLIGFAAFALILSACGVSAPAANENTNSAAPAEAANTNAAMNLELEGLLESVDGDAWMVSGNSVFVNAGVLGGLVVMPGDTVRVEGVKNDDGSWTAVKVQLVQAANANTNAANANTNDANSNSANTNASNTNSANTNTANSNTSSASANTNSDNKGGSNSNSSDD